MLRRLGNTSPAPCRTATARLTTPVGRRTAWRAAAIAWCLAAAPSPAARPDFARIDAHVAGIEVPATGNLPELVGRIVAPARRDIERVRAIAWWMALKIEYDHEAHRVGVAQLENGQQPMWVLGQNEPVMVLQRRKAICMGYSKLFVACCGSIGIEAVEVSGNTRYSDEGHSWNAVRFDGAWHLVDVSSMASGAGNRGGAAGPPAEFYFLPPPEQFIFSHFPGEERWQLLKKPVSRREFSSVPVVLPPLFAIGVTPDQLRAAARAGVAEFVPTAYMPDLSITLLEGPLARRLTPGREYRFRIRAADHVGVHLNDGGERLAFAKQGDVFVATVKPTGRFLRIGLERQPGAIAGLLDYEVAAVAPDPLGSRIADLINDARRRQGLATLAHDPDLDASAHRHAEEMGRQRGTPGRARCLVAATDNRDGTPPAELATALVGSMLEQEQQREWASAPRHRRIGAGAVTVDGRTYFCLEFQ